jgi:aspartate/methionine/tyrosine aminotransferase
MAHIGEAHIEKQGDSDKHDSEKHENKEDHKAQPTAVSHASVHSPSTHSPSTHSPSLHSHRFADVAHRALNYVKYSKEAQSWAHVQLRQAIPVESSHSKPALDPVKLPGFVSLAQTGVTYVTDRANALGFSHGNPEWANFGQGAPEVGPIPHAERKPTTISFDEEDHEYAPVTGHTALRKKIADLYNGLYRKDKVSKYTADNVCVVPGGRAGLTRVAAAIGDVNVGFFLPEYTAYEEMLYIFKKFQPIPTNRREENHYAITPDQLQNEILERGLRVVVTSNPCNPTGKVIEGEELKKWVDICRTTHTSLILDEFYSHYIYTHPPEQNGRTVSAAEFINDVDDDSVVLIDGLTKNWRCPGWRICWIIGPKILINTLKCAGSFLEGGANHPLQVAAVELLDIERTKREAKYLQDHFRMKRDFVVERLNKMGIVCQAPEATFYVWANLSHLPPPLDNGLSFFEMALTEKVIVVPGIFFDVNPGKRRELFHSPCHHYIRISFGPTMEVLKLGMDSLERLVNTHKVKTVASPIVGEKH